MSRKAAREIALHILFELTYDVAPAEEVISDRLSEETRARFAEEIPVYARELAEPDERFVRLIVSGVSERRGELDAEIGRRALRWETGRISRLALSVLRMAFYEVLWVPDTDRAVIANEAVELAKKYDTKESAAFINGILGTLIREQAEA